MRFKLKKIRNKGEKGYGKNKRERVGGKDW